MEVVAQCMTLPVIPHQLQVLLRVVWYFEEGGVVSCDMEAVALCMTLQVIPPQLQVMLKKQKDGKILFGKNVNTNILLLICWQKFSNNVGLHYKTVISKTAAGLLTGATLRPRITIPIAPLSMNSMSGMCGHVYCKYINIPFKLTHFYTFSENIKIIHKFYRALMYRIVIPIASPSMNSMSGMCGHVFVSLFILPHMH